MDQRRLTYQEFTLLVYVQHKVPVLSAVLWTGGAQILNISDDNLSQSRQDIAAMGFW